MSIVFSIKNPPPIAIRRRFSFLFNERASQGLLPFPDSQSDSRHRLPALLMLFAGLVCMDKRESELCVNVRTNAVGYGFSNHLPTRASYLLEYGPSDAGVACDGFKGPGHV